MKKKNLIIIGGVFLVGLLIGYLIFGGNTSIEHSEDNSTNQSAETTTESETIWTCSMHPQIKMPEPGDCPICGI
jgi:Cu(I)/Ag(I) efflux system membrane fusion protein